jgi:hypothetical protein
MTSNPGDPGLLFDVEYSLRAWESNNWQVALYETDLKHGVGGHSSLVNEAKIKRRNDANEGARKYLAATYPPLRCVYRGE